MSNGCGIIKRHIHIITSGGGGGGTKIIVQMWGVVMHEDKLLHTAARSVEM